MFLILFLFFFIQVVEVNYGGGCLLDEGVHF